MQLCNNCQKDTFSLTADVARLREERDRYKQALGKIQMFRTYSGENPLAYCEGIASLALFPPEAQKDCRL